MLSQGNHTIQRVFDFYLHSVDVRVILQCVKKIPCSFLAFFPKPLGIFNEVLTRLLHIPLHTRLQVFIELFPTLT